MLPEMLFLSAAWGSRKGCLVFCLQGICKFTSDDGLGKNAGCSVTSSQPWGPGTAQS